MSTNYTSIKNNRLNLTIPKWKSVLLFIVVLYIFTYQLWIELMGINNPYRYSIYVIIILGFYSYFVNNIKITFHFYDFAFVVFSLYSVLNFMGSEYRGSLLDLYDYLFIPLVYVAGLYFCRSKGSLLIFKKLIINLGTITSIISIYEFLSNRLLLSTGVQHTLLLHIRPCSLFGSPIIGGLVSAIVSIVIFQDGFKHKTRILLLLLNILAVLFTLSRGPMVSLLGGMLFIWYFKRIRFIDKINRVIFFVIFVVYFFIVFSTLKFSKEYVILYRISQIFNWTSEGGNLSRLDTWYKLLNNVNNVFWGNGMGFLEYKGIDPESGLFAVFVETGILGVILYFLPFVLIVLNSLRYTKHSLENRLIILLPLSMMVVIIIDNLTLQVLQSLIIQLLMGLTCAYCSLLTNHCSYEIINKG